jgi:hypothetical protein
LSAAAQTVKSTEAMTSAMTGVAKAMGAMNKQMNPQKIQQVSMTRSHALALAPAHHSHASRL